jgi:uncharacterized membrane protein HdeD (DUF308 family)
MSSILTTSRPGLPLRHELDALHKDWIWYLVLGIALIVLGTLALGTATVMTTFLTVIFLGVLFLLAGATQCVGAFWSRRWTGVVLGLLEGVLCVVLGLLFIKKPAMALASLTLLIACFLMVGGIFRIVAALAMRFPNWGWALFGGVVNLALGLLIYAEWPASSLMVLGIFVGVEMIFGGAFWVSLALALRKLPRVLAPAA